MLGAIKVLKGVNDEILYPTTLSDAVYVDPQTTLSEKLRLLEFHKSDLIIDLKRWGIAAGLPTKPYNLTHYYRAKKNSEGFNRVLKFAHENGYKHVILPKGEYSLCFPFEIYMQSFVTFNLGGSRLKVMYDSLNRSPYDTRSTDEQIHTFGGISFVFAGVKHAHLINGIIEGDAYERTFAPGSEEDWYEHTYGVSIREGTSFSSVSHCEIKGYMGDNINVVSGGAIRNGFDNEWFNGTVNKVDGTTIAPSTAHLYTEMITIPSGSYDRVLSLAGQGYNRLTGLRSKYFDILFYGANDAYLGILENRKIQAPVPFPDKAKKYRLQFYDQAIDSDPALFLDYGSNCHHNMMEFNLVADGHRGGVTMGGSYNVIQFNEFARNGKYSSAFLDGVPTFPDPTRYAINQEDSYGDNCMILNNHFHDGFHGVLVGCYSTHIHDNIFHNIDYGAIILYTVEYGSIKGNYIDDSDIVFMTNSLTRTVNVEGNFVRGRLDMGYADEFTTISSNYIQGTFDIGTARFQDNIVELVPSTEGPYTLYGANLKDSIIRSYTPGTKVSVVFNLMADKTMQGVEWKDIDIEFRFEDPILQLTLKDCEFLNCQIGTDSNDTAKKLRIVESKLGGNTVIYPQMVNGAKQMSVLIERCEIALTSYLVYLATNYANGVKVRLKDNQIALSGAPQFLISSEYNTNNAAVIEITDNEFTYTGATPLTTMRYLNSEDRAAPLSFIVDNYFTNMTMGTITATTKIALYHRRKAHFQAVTLAGTSPTFTATVTHNLGTAFVNTLITLADGTVQAGLTVKVTSVNAIQITGSSALALNVFVKRM